MIKKANLEAAAKSLDSTPVFSMKEYAAPCGSPACVLGHYADRFDLQEAFELVSVQKMRAVGREYRIREIETGNLLDYDSSEVCEHFGISVLQADALFGSWGCGDAKTAEEAQAFIREFIAKDGALPECGDCNDDCDYDPDADDCGSDNCTVCKRLKA